MKISVITPVYNGVKFIRETIESVLAQTGDFELEYIICDSLSDDGTAEILKEYATTGKIQLISRKDQGPCDAINYGMNLATGDIGCWLNADDLFEPDALQKVVTAFKKAPNTQWMYGRCRIINEAGVEIRKPITWYKNLLGYFYSRNILLCENFINQPATFWRMELWRELGGGLNSKYKAAWDYELWLKMAESSPALHLRENLAIFRRHDGSISENNFEQQFTEELAIASEYGNCIHHLIHAFNKWKIITAYKILS